MGVERETIYLSLPCHHQNDSCIKMGSDGSHFDVINCDGHKSEDCVHKPQFFKQREIKIRSGSGNTETSYANARFLCRHS